MADTNRLVSSGALAVVGQRARKGWTTAGICCHVGHCHDTWSELPMRFVTEDLWSRRVIRTEGIYMYSIFEYHLGLFVHQVSGCV